MKTILLLTGLLSFQFSFGQRRDKCELLKFLLNHPGSRVFMFQFSGDKDKPILLVDTARFFAGCDVGEISKRTVQLVSDSMYLSKAHTDIFSVHVTSKSPDRYYISVYSRSSHGIGSVNVKKNRRKYHVIKTRYGILD